MTYFQAIILGLTQGMTEFLPVSSSAHLVIVPEILNWKQHSLTFDIIVHLGTLIAITSFYKSRIKNLMKSFFNKQDVDHVKNKNLVIHILLSTIFTFIIFIVVHQYIRNVLGSLEVIKYTLILGGILLILSDLFNRKINKHLSLNKKIAIFIGIGQGMSLIRGMSRSGLMLTFGLFSKVKREELMEFIFLSSIPIILGGLILELSKFETHVINESFGVLLLGLITSATSGYLAITLLNKFLHKNILYYSGVYRIILGIVIFLL